MSDSLPAHLPSKFKRVHLELTNRCNFSCMFCPGVKVTRQRGVMNEALAKSALDQISKLGLAEKVTFHVMGEPLLHPKFFQILDHARTLNLPVGLTTNGALLTPETIQKIAGRDLHQIDISLQTPDRESFAVTRGTCLDFNQYRTRLLDLLVACAERPVHPIFKIRIMTTRFARRMRQQLQIPDFMGNADALRSTVLEWTRIVRKRLKIGPADSEELARRIKKINLYGWNVIEISPKVFVETCLLIDWGNSFARDGIIETRYGYCFGMRDHFSILYSGDLVLCCMDFDGQTSIGNLGQLSLVRILNSPDLERIVKGFKRGRLVHPYCRRCLGSHSRLGAFVKPTASMLGLKVLKRFLYRRYKVFD